MTVKYLQSEDSDAIYMSIKKVLSHILSSRAGRYVWNATQEFKSGTWSQRGKQVGWRTLKLINLACAVHLFTEYVGNISPMSGPSMLPTLANSGEVVIENIITHQLFPNNLSRGDLITLRSPLDASRIICKRILGLPGDVICVDPTGVIVSSTEYVVVPKGHVWIVGDNAAHSRDSREYGPVPMALIRGKLFARIWPPRDFTIFRNPITFID